MISFLSKKKSLNTTSRLGKQHISNAPKVTVLLVKALNTYIFFFLDNIEEHWLENEMS